MNICAKASDLKNVADFEKCANCGACYNACPTSAITVKDELFYKVTVDEDKCVGCGKCVAVCPVNTPRPAQNLLAAYSAIHNDKNLVAESSSGGAFSALADCVLAQGGVVWGAGFGADFSEVIVQSTQTVSLDCLRRSKYVESLAGDSFSQIKKLLDANKTVLFCGTPCQVAGLVRFVGSRQNLFTLDFSCGGLPSHKLYQEWLRALEKKYKSEAADVNFRSKHFGWGVHCVSVAFKNGKKVAFAAANDPYFASFLNGKLSVREYCYQCDFSDNHYADLILADYWKYKDTFPSPNHTGISLVLVNSEKGAALWERARDAMQTRELPLEKAAYNIRPTRKPDSQLARRAAFLEKAECEGLHKAAEAYSLPGQWNRLLYRLRIELKKVIQKKRK